MTAQKETPDTVATVAGAEQENKRKSIVALYSKALCAIRFESVIALGDLAALVVGVLVLLALGLV